MDIDGFSDYCYIKDENKIIKKSKRKVIKISGKSGSEFVKLKGDSGKWESLSLSRIKYLCGIVADSEVDAKEIPFTDGKYKADSDGNIYSFNLKACGKKLKPSLTTKGYLAVSIIHKGRMRTVEVHQLVASTFIMRDYVERGLVCMHDDDNKLNCKLDNLTVGTYAKNNKDAYKTGVNSGNILGINRLQITQHGEKHHGKS